MAEPLSVIASVITVAGTLGETLSHIRAFKNAPDEVLALNNELSDFSIVVRHVETQLLGGQI